MASGMQDRQSITEVDAGTGVRGRRRVVTAGSARSLLLTVLGELVLPTREPVWNQSLLHVLKGLGLSENTARQAIVRGASAGWVVGEKLGRETCWTLTDAGVNLIEQGSKRVYWMSAPREPWDGDWVIMMVTVPHRQKHARKPLYSALSWAGFGSPMAGVWANPHADRAAEAKKIISDLELKDSTVSFVGTSLDIGLTEQELVRQSWDLDGVAGRYSELIERFEGQEPEPGDDLLFTHVALVSEWQRFPFLDPQLPEELLPDWIGREAAELFVSLREKWTDAAHERWRQVVEISST